MSFTPGFGLLVQSTPPEGIASQGAHSERRLGPWLQGLLTQFSQWARRCLRLRAP
jgi:hypothetical protein